MQILSIIVIFYLKFSLWNGIEIFLKEDNSYPLVSFMVVVNSGSLYEEPRELGLTHFLEHMLFDGTKQFTRENLRNEFENNGIYVNAFTREDYTAFFFTGPSDKTEKGISLLSQMLFESIFPEKEFEKEKGVVIQEMYMERAREENTHNENALKYLFSGLPYANPVIGYEETIKNLEREKVIEFWKKHYTPSNMTIIATGDFKTEEIMELINLYFGKYPPGEKEKEKEYVDFKYKEKELFKKRGDFTKNYLTIGFNAPVLNEENSEYFLVLQKLLNMEKYKEKIKDEFKEIEEISFEYISKKKAAIFTSYFVYEKNITDEIFKKMPEIIKGILKNMEEKEFERAKNSIIYEKIYNEENYTYALIFKSYYIPFGGPPFEERLFEKIKKMKIKEFKEFFKNYPFEKRRGFASIKEEEEKEEKIKKDYEIKRESLNGANLIFKYDPGSPVLAIHVLAKNRNLIEKKPGVSEILSRLIVRNIPEIEELGIRIKTHDDPYLPFDDYYHRKDFIYIRFEVPQENAFKGIEVLNRILNETSFNEKDVEEIKREIISILKRQENTPDYISEKKLWENLFEETTYSKPILGEEEGIKSINLEDLLEAHKAFFSSSNLIIGIVSPFPFEKIANKLKIKINEKAEFPSEKIEIYTKPFLKEILTETKQAYIRIARIVPPVETEDNTLLKLISLILSKKLQEIIREKMGLSYRLGAEVADYKGFSIFEIVIGTSSEEWKKVIDKTFEIIEEMAQKPPDKIEIENILNSYRGKHLRYHQSRINQAYFLTFYDWIGTGYEYDFKLVEILKNSDYGKIPSIIKKYLKREDFSIVVAGKTRRENEKN